LLLNLLLKWWLSPSGVWAADPLLERFGGFCGSKLTTN
jgi:hypothetical protein